MPHDYDYVIVPHARPFPTRSSCRPRVQRAGRATSKVSTWHFVLHSRWFGHTILTGQGSWGKGGQQGVTYRGSWAL